MTSGGGGETGPVGRNGCPVIGGRYGGCPVTGALADGFGAGRVVADRRGATVVAVAGADRLGSGPGRTGTAVDGGADVTTTPAAGGVGDPWLSVIA
ncbi:hypothetical protein [Actinoplanes palleronii]|uniref:Uncharacterized protein n=1 Tax=Actinoplanes palleronii TaxID=113570 RepID=A0ABQ4B0G2_9ACTN|nr:hypothetical protein [Actinoplanes palleronii]GIE64178.1 hypothetical protein Apa02nite_002860 [Actinoplanes palleronii]